MLCAGLGRQWPLKKSVPVSGLEVHTPVLHRKKDLVMA